MRYRWLMERAGRKVGFVEVLDQLNGITPHWQTWGWIEPIDAPKAAPVAVEPHVEAVEEPTGDRSVRRTTLGRRVLRNRE